VLSAFVRGQFLVQIDRVHHFDATSLDELEALWQEAKLTDAGIE
jgi:hypothetical protein